MKNTLKASLTVEASMILPMVFFTIISVIYMSIYLHDVTIMRAITHEALDRYQLAYSNKIDMATGEVLSPAARLDRGLYWRFGSDGSMKELVQAYIQEEGDKRMLTSDGTIDVQTVLHHYILKQNITIEVRKSFGTPLGPVNKLLGISGVDTDMVVISRIGVKDPTEVIRNMDYLDDLSDHLSPIKEAKKAYREKIKDIIGFFQNL